MANRPRLQWTLQAAAYVALGALCIIIGPLLDSAHLTVLGGLLLLWMASDAAVAVVGSPRPRLAVSASRVPELSRVEVTVDARVGRGGQQFQVHLDRGLALPEGQNNIWTPRPGIGHHKFEFEAVVRGPQRVGPIEIRSWSPARTWAVDEQMSHHEEVEVVPRIVEEKNVGLRSRVLKPMQGRFQVNRPGQGFDFFTLRQYASGDTIRDVNWKASARYDDLIVNQRQRETQSEILLLLDARIVAGVGPAGKTPLDRACRIVLALYEEASSSRDIVRFVAYGTEYQGIPAQGADRVRALEGLLARLPAEGATPLMDAWVHARRDMRSQGPVVVVSSAEGDPTLTSALADMVGRGHAVTLISPRPTGTAFDAADAVHRRRSRDACLEEARNRGAAVLDWKDGEAPRVLAAEQVAVV